MQKLRKLLIFRRIFSKVAIATATENQKYLYGKKLSVRKFSIEIFVNFKNFQTDATSCLTHYEAQISFFS